MRLLALVVLAVLLLVLSVWLILEDRRARRRAREWDAHVEQIRRVVAEDRHPSGQWLAPEDRPDWPPA